MKFKLESSIQTLTDLTSQYTDKILNLLTMVKV